MHCISLYLRKYLRRTQKLRHCNVFIMHEYLAEFQFCKVILHLLSDAGAASETFFEYIISTLTTAMASFTKHRRRYSAGPQFQLFKSSTFAQSVFSQYIFQLRKAKEGQRKKICRLCERYSCRKQDKKCLLFQLASFHSVWSSLPAAASPLKRIWSPC